MTEHTLILIRHAKSSWAEVMPDHERPLNHRGRRDAAAIGRLLDRRGVRADLALVSSAARTRETWRRAAQAGALAASVIETDVLYDAEYTDIVEAVRRLPPDVATAILVAHFPAIPDTVAYLAEGRGPEAAWDMLRGGCPTATVITLSVPGEWADIDEVGADLVDVETPRG